MESLLKGIAFVVIGLGAGRLAIGSHTAEVCRENFEGHASGTLPSPWVFSGNAPPVLTDSHSYSGNQSLHLLGVLNRCRSTIAYRHLGAHTPIEIAFTTRCGSEDFGGHPAYVTVALNTGSTSATAGRALLRFQNHGNIYVESSKGPSTEGFFCVSLSRGYGTHYTLAIPWSLRPV